MFQYYTWDSEEEIVQLIQYPNHSYRVGLKNLENYVWICAHVSDLDQAGVVSAEIALYLDKYTIQPSMKYICHF